MARYAGYGGRARSGARVDTGLPTAYVTGSLASFDPAPEDPARMLGTVAKRLFGSANDRFIKSLRNTVDAINALEPELEALSDAELLTRTDRLRERLNAGARRRACPERRSKENHPQLEKMWAR